MPNNLFSLFDDRLKNDRDLIAGAPQTLESIAAQEEEQERILTKIKQFEESDPKIDYSDFSNFVFFNSALDYFNITGEKILNEYPYDGSVASLENFTHALDGYQRHVLKNWPSRSGHLRIDPAISASWVKVEDVGIQDGLARSTFISPGTGSLSLEFWFNTPRNLTGSNDVMVIAQKITGSGDGFTAYLTGSLLGFRMVSGSVTSEVFAPFSGGDDMFFSCVFDRSISPTMTIMSGSSTSFPTTVTSSSSDITGQVYIGPTAFTFGSGSLSGKVTRPYTGSLDQFSIWNIPRQIGDVSSSFNVKLYAQKGLLGLWRFNESGSMRNQQANAIVFDHSGHRLNGRIQGYHDRVRGSGSIVLNDRPDPILLYDAPEVQALIYEQQLSGTSYDRTNDNLIVNLLPDAFFRLEEYTNTTVLQNFIFILARQFDFIKQRIDQFVHVLRTNYTDFDQAPDALLSDVAKFFGWEFTGNFLNAEAFQYILGKNVLKNVDSNKELDKKLFEIKNEFWRRTLINLIYLYKTKGTKESVESLLRIYGVNKNFVRLKEYGYRPFVEIQTNRIHVEKSAYALRFFPNQAGEITGGSLRAPLGFSLGGSHTHGNYLISKTFQGRAESVESRVLFPTSTNENNPAAISSGSIWSVDAAPIGGGPTFVLSRLSWFKDSISSMTGTLVYSGSEGVLSASNLPIFDGKWYNLTTRRDRVSGTINVDVRHLDYDRIDYASVSSVSASILTSSFSLNIFVGATGTFDSQMYSQEVRVWNKNLSRVEMDDHTLNFQSYGVDNHLDLYNILLHWRLNENVVALSGGRLPDPAIRDVSTNGASGSGFFFADLEEVYEGFLFDYNYIAPPEFGWNEEKIRVYDQGELSPAEMFHDNQTLALEFNMIDALNEDISQALSAMEGFNNYIGMPANRYRATYPDLTALRSKYFSRLQGRLNFRVFADMLEFFDKSFVTLIQRLIPARAIFLGEEFVVESHMLERPKLQWNYRRQPPQFAPEGSIGILDRF